MFWNALLLKIKKFYNKYSMWPIGYIFVMSGNEKILFDKKIRKSKYFLEFGIGGSTVRALTKSDAVIFSVDSSFVDTNYA